MDIDPDIFLLRARQIDLHLVALSALDHIETRT
jgi:hypothetical protein